MRFLLRTSLTIGLLLTVPASPALAACDHYLSDGQSWKLIRDLLPQRYRDEGWEAKVEEITDTEELKKLLIRKLQEEVLEFSENPSAEEMADLLEVLKALQSVHQLDPDEVQAIQIKKFSEKGGFEKGYVLKIDSLKKTDQLP